MSVFSHPTRWLTPQQRYLKITTHLIETIFTLIIPRLWRLALQSSSNQEADRPSPCKNHETHGDLVIQRDRSNTPHEHNE